jgi:protein-tyrosine phosphatase
MRKRLSEKGLAERIEIDSAGTHGLHAGEPPDPRAQDAGRDYGLDMRAQTARKFEGRDFQHFDLVLAMDRQHYTQLARLADDVDRYKLALFMDYAVGEGARDVPDPYYGGPQGFYEVLTMIESGVAGLIEDYLRTHGSASSS